MFTEVCLVRKNTKRLIRTLENMGYKCINVEGCTLDAHNYDGKGNHKKIDEGTAIITSYYGNFGVIYDIDVVVKKGRVDCGVDEELFLAIAAINNETDINQWFTNSDYSCWVFCDKDSFEYEFELDRDIRCMIAKSQFHKASAEELINHF